MQSWWLDCYYRQDYFLQDNPFIYQFFTHYQLLSADIISLVEHLIETVFGPLPGCWYYQYPSSDAWPLIILIRRQQYSPTSPCGDAWPSILLMLTELNVASRAGHTSWQRLARPEAPGFMIWTRWGVIWNYQLQVTEPCNSLRSSGLRATTQSAGAYLLRLSQASCKNYHQTMRPLPHFVAPHDEESRNRPVHPVVGPIASIRRYNSSLAGL
jgi:hypothetical protein